MYSIQFDTQHDAESFIRDTRLKNLIAPYAVQSGESLTFDASSIFSLSNSQKALISRVAEFYGCIAILSK